MQYRTIKYGTYNDKFSLWRKISPSGATFFDNFFKIDYFKKSDYFTPCFVVETFLDLLKSNDFNKSKKLNFNSLMSEGEYFHDIFEQRRIIGKSVNCKFARMLALSSVGEFLWKYSSYKGVEDIIQDLLYSYNTQPSSTDTADEEECNCTESKIKFYQMQNTNWRYYHDHGYYTVFINYRKKKQYKFKKRSSKYYSYNDLRRKRFTVKKCNSLCYEKNCMAEEKELLQNDVEDCDSSTLECQEDNSSDEYESMISEVSTESKKTDTNQHMYVHSNSLSTQSDSDQSSSKLGMIRYENQKGEKKQTRIKIKKENLKSSSYVYSEQNRYMTRTRQNVLRQVIYNEEFDEI